MVRAHRATAVVTEGQSISVSGLPIAAGERVEVIILAGVGLAPDAPTGDDVRRRLRGSVLKYDHPFDPAVPPEEWDAVR
jgi:ABC-type molybdate transport system ATPase subunit